jgi:hypothetical protein
VVPELLAQDVVLLAGLADPWARAEELPPGVAGSRSLEFQARPVHQHRPELADLGCSALEQTHESPCRHRRRARSTPTARVRVALRKRYCQ